MEDNSAKETANANSKTNTGAMANVETTANVEATANAEAMSHAHAGKCLDAANGTGMSMSMSGASDASLGSEAAGETWACGSASKTEASGAPDSGKGSDAASWEGAGCAPAISARAWQKRTHYCGEIGESLLGQPVTVVGWVQKSRNLGGLIFADIRDRSGIVQAVFSDASGADVFAAAEQLRGEYVVSASGEVRRRADAAVNAKMATGAYEIAASSLSIINEADTPPIYIEEALNVNEATRLKYRYLDLRRPDMQRNLMLRHRVAKAARDYFDENGFLEIETPMLTKSTPEGARDYLVPSRIYPGAFFALPQSPQLFKQLLMVAGFDRYMQIARCFRDEDLRADRQPEFTQIDVEMSFVTADDVIGVNEGFLKALFKKTLGVDIETPLPRLTYTDAMRRFGSDKPDTRFGMELADITPLARGCGFQAFAGAVSAGGSVRAINAKGCAAFTRKEIDSLAEYAKTYMAKGLAWAAVGGGAGGGGSGAGGNSGNGAGGKGTGNSSGGNSSAGGGSGASGGSGSGGGSGAGETRCSFARFLDEATFKAMLDAAGAEPGDLILFVADASDDVALNALGQLRVELARRLGLLKKDEFKLLWVIEFPLLEYDTDGGRWAAKHHPFTSPMDEDVPLLDSDPGKARAKAYDVVINGMEAGGGSIRINRQDLQQKMFSLLGFTQEDANERFGFLLDAFRYGTPPHGGIAYGLDRLAMILAGCDSIKDVIAFPKAQTSSCLLTGAPAAVDAEQLETLGIGAAPQ
ncbi:MAG: aspartate--tRNA ligase [Clostridiales bacterium]|jgi:aspartyl-tRNA synthetase|nr:aspartate--tRNA ligase [Clostridiales bacterium]